MKKSLKGMLKRMGYLSDSRGIMDRYIQVGGAWDEHLRNSRNYIVQVLSERKIRNLAVYGSGWLLDFPLDEVTQMAGHVWLYDVVHPSQILHKLRHYNKITAVTSDITGDGLIAAYEAAQLFKKKGIKPQPDQLIKRNFEPAIEPDYSISLNILSQIGDVVTQYLQRCLNFSEEESGKLVSLMQQTHLNLLPEGKGCLITDTQEMIYNEQDQLTATKDLILCSLPVGVNEVSWKWQFDPLGEYHAGMKTVLKVVAMQI